MRSTGHPEHHQICGRAHVELSKANVRSHSLLFEVNNTQCLSQRWIYSAVMWASSLRCNQNPIGNSSKVRSRTALTPPPFGTIEESALFEGEPGSCRSDMNRFLRPNAISVPPKVFSGRARDRMEMCRTFLSQLGTTPASWARLPDVTPPDEEPGLWAHPRRNYLAEGRETNPTSLRAFRHGQRFPARDPLPGSVLNVRC